MLTIGNIFKASAARRNLRARNACDARRLHFQSGMTALVMLIPLAPLLAALEISTQLALISLPVATLGVMHGALDPWVADRLLLVRSGARHRVWFIHCYLAVMAMVVTMWVFTPLMTLTTFLLISIWHFGQQDAAAIGSRDDPLAILVTGSIPVLTPVVAHPDQVAVIFDWLVGLDPVETAPLLSWLLNPVIALWLVGFAMLVSRKVLFGEPGLGRCLTMIAIVLSAMILLPPLIAFAAYFCLLHSFGHLLELHATHEGPWRRWDLQDWARRLWPATIAAAFSGLIAWWLITALDPQALASREALARVIFCGLAALTVPHVILHALFEAGVRDQKRT